jgi:Flp pilus assembly protein TadG
VHTSNQPGSDDGFQAVELAIIFPTIILLILLAVLAIRVSVATNEVEGAARAGARAASVASQGQADARARSAVARSVAVGSVHCLGEPNVAVQYVEAGSQRAVRVVVQCRVKVADLGFGIARTVSASAEDVVDPLSTLDAP